MSLARTQVSTTKIKRSGEKSTDLATMIWLKRNGPMFETKLELYSKNFCYFIYFDSDTLYMEFDVILEDGTPDEIERRSFNRFVDDTDDEVDMYSKNF